MPNTEPRLPANVDLDAAALAEPLAVVLHAFRKAHLQPGARVLVLGAGAVGLLMCSLARASGCTTVIAVDIEQGKLDFAKEMNWATGTHTLPRGARVSGADALEVAKSSWEGLKSDEVVTGVLGLEEGFDAVFECTGVESCMQMAVLVSRRVPFCVGSHLLPRLKNYAQSMSKLNASLSLSEDMVLYSITRSHTGRRTRDESPLYRNGHSQPLPPHRSFLYSRN